MCNFPMSVVGWFVGWSTCYAMYLRLPIDTTVVLEEERERVKEQYNI